MKKFIFKNLSVLGFASTSFFNRSLFTRLFSGEFRGIYQGIRDKILPIALLIGIPALLLFSCQKEDPVPASEKGSFGLEIGLSVMEHEENKGLKAFVPLTDFRVEIYQSDGTPVMAFETVSSMPDTIALAQGNYLVVAHSNNNTPAEFDNPFYYGVSDVFTISSNTHQAVSVTCSLSNTMVSVTWTENIINNYISYSATVSSSLGSLVFSGLETRAGYFQPAPLDIVVELAGQNPDGSPNLKTLTGSIPDPLPGRHYEVIVNATIDNGSGTFLILMDETEIPVEIVEIIDGTEEPVATQDSIIAYGDLLITEIMFDPSALSDTEGEWLEIYNSSNLAINLQNLVLDRDGAYQHAIRDSIVLQPGGYYVLARTATATPALNTYVYGSVISLSNTGAVLSLYNEDTTTGPGALIFSVNYGESAFPAQAGASISLNPNLLNAADAVLGTSWCISGSVYGAGDLGTPGNVNDACL